MSRAKKTEKQEPEQKPNQQYTIEPAATSGWLVRSHGTPVYVAQKKEEAEAYLAAFNKK